MINGFKENFDFLENNIEKLNIRQTFHYCLKNEISMDHVFSSNS